MEIRRVDARTTEPANPAWFTGSVWIDALAAAAPPSRLHVARVTFAPSARTAWHTHPHGQILVVVSGTGLVQKAGEPVRALAAGDTVAIAPGERHWHGASPAHVFVHVAMQEADADGKQATWLEHVTDEEYATPSDAP